MRPSSSRSKSRSGPALEKTPSSVMSTVLPLTSVQRSSPQPLRRRQVLPAVSVSSKRSGSQTPPAAYIAVLSGSHRMKPEPSARRRLVAPGRPVNPGVTAHGKTEEVCRGVRSNTSWRPSGQVTAVRWGRAVVQHSRSNSQAAPHGCWPQPGAPSGPLVCTLKPRSSSRQPQPKSPGVLRSSVS